jgi:Tfp pilus assembly PilM family ATPase
MSEKQLKSRFIGVLISQDTFKMLNLNALEDDRSLSSYVRRLIEKDANKRLGTVE